METTIKLNSETKKMMEKFMPHSKTYDQYVRELIYKVNELVKMKIPLCPKCQSVLIYLDTDDFKCIKCDEYFEPRELRTYPNKFKEQKIYIPEIIRKRKWVEGK